MAAAVHLPVLDRCGRKGAGDGGFTQGRTGRSVSHRSTGAFEGTGDGGFTQVHTWRSAVDSCNALERARPDLVIAAVLVVEQVAIFTRVRRRASTHTTSVDRMKTSKLGVCAGVPARTRRNSTVRGKCLHG